MRQHAVTRCCEAALMEPDRQSSHDRVTSSPAESCERLAEDQILTFWLRTRQESFHGLSPQQESNTCFGGR